MSRALNGTGRVSEETRVRVLAAAEALGYRPSRLAQGFRSGSTSTLGLVTSSVTAPGAADFIGGVFEVTEAAGYSVIVAESTDGSYGDLRSLDFPIDGALLAPGAEADHRRALRSRGVPLVDARSCLEAERDPSAEYEAALQAFRMIVRFGHTHIGLLELASDVEAERHAVRGDAAEDALEDSPLRAIGEARLHDLAVATPDEAYQRMRAVLSDALITVVSVGSDALLGPVLSALHDANALPGRELSVLAVAHSSNTVDLHPRMSFLAHEARQDGRRAALRLLAEVKPEAYAGAASPAGVPHWRFDHQPSIASSPVIPSC